MRKTPVTAYGLIGTDWVRLTAAILETGSAVFVRADGTNSTLPTLPTTFRTSGDMANVAAQLGHRVNFSAVPSIGLKAHTWKGTFDLAGIVEHMGGKAELVAQLQASYAIVEEIAA